MWVPEMDHLARLRALEQLHDDALFARGFLVCDRAAAYVPRSWHQSEVGGYRVHHDPRLNVTTASRDAITLSVIGEAFDLRAPDRTNRDIAEDLARDRELSEERFYDALDWLNGRYAILYTDCDGTYVLHDATGMRSIYHTQDNTLVGSHASLVAVNGGKSYQERPRARFGFPGRRTPYADVVLLIPNHQLTIGANAGPTRYYPRYPLLQRPAPEVAAQATQWLQRAMRAIALRHPHLHASLTAGIDSRCTLATSRQVVSQMSFFTYYRGADVDTDEVDRRIAVSLANRLGIRHQVLDYANQLSSYPVEFDALCAENSAYPHMRPTVRAFTSRFDPATDVHIRSNLSAIGKAFYQRVKHIARPMRAPEELTRAYLSSAKEEPSAAQRASIYSDTADFFHAAGYDDLAELRDTRDMFHWEHRMGMWHGPALAESDVAIATYSSCNSRVILDLFLSPPESERAKSAQLREVVARAWPQCLELPLNPKDG